MLKCCCSIDWCVGALVGALFGGLVPWLVHCLMHFMVHCLLRWLVRCFCRTTILIIGLFDCYYCILLFLLLECRLVLWYALDF